MRHCAAALLLAVSLSATAEDWPALFDEATAIVEAQFFDPAMNGLDWPAVTASYRQRLEADMDREAFAALFNELLAELEASHTRLYTRDEPAWYQLAGVFVDGYAPLAKALAPWLVDGAPVYHGIGVQLERRAQGWFVTGVLNGFPASEAGVLLGDRLVSADGARFHPIRSFAGRAGEGVALTVERRPGETQTVTVTPAALDGRTMFETAMRESTRTVALGSAAIGVIRPWSWAGQRYQDILVGELLNGSLRDADALVLDVRGGWGGASPRFLNLFVDRHVEAGSTGRDGTTMSFASGWSRPVVLLTDERSRSGKELIAHGFRSLGKGPIVGERTAGAVVAGRISALSDGSLLYVASADVAVDGKRLEGVGVAPDIEVPFDPAFAAGRDIQLDRAIEIAAGLVSDTQSSERR
ncbi:MAG: S41 family peptidase [Pseudomonadota bacterium]